MTGAVMLALGGWAIPQGPTIEDQIVSETPLLRIPLSSLGPDGATFLLRLPDGPQWDRIRSHWGDPGVMLFAVGDKRFSVIELSSLGIDVDVTASGVVLPPEVGDFVPFGRDFLQSGGHYGVVFHGKPGEELLVNLRAADPATLPVGQLIAKYEWGRGPGKDHAIAPAIEQIITEVGWGLVLAGVGAVAFGLGRWSSPHAEARTTADDVKRPA